jgi:hypothetical protein
VPQSEYSPESVRYARVEGPALLKGPIKAQFAGAQALLALLKQVFDSCDIFGSGKVERGIFVIKLKEEFEKAGLMHA